MMPKLMPARPLAPLMVALHPTKPWALVLALALSAFFATSHVSAQGCSACRDTTAGSAPQARAGLRRGILVLGVPAGALFLGMIVVARRIEKERAD